MAGRTIARCLGITHSHDMTKEMPRNSITVGVLAHWKTAEKGRKVRRGENALHRNRGTDPRLRGLRRKLRPVVDDAGLPVGRDPPEHRADTHPDPGLLRAADELGRQARPLVELDDCEHVGSHLLELLARRPDDRVSHDFSQA